MSNETIFITGGASGIGLAIAESALQRGWRVVAADRDQDSLAKQRESFPNPDGALRFEELDVTDEASVVMCMERCEAEHGPITGVVNSAGAFGLLPMSETDVEQFRRILDVNVLGTFIVAREAARRMIPRGAGAILNIGSVVGHIGVAGRVAYGASKGAIGTMTQSMAAELAPSGIRVNAIAPGLIRTDRQRAIHSEASQAAWLANTPQGRYGLPSDVAHAAIYLLDASLAGYVTGQILAVDGGFLSSKVLVK
jgi:NAD(P)-dependent dehydrogenase (short-subunit alcohol dehydrogenase family)